MSEQGHGGRLVARALKALGVRHLFTLTGGHIFPILDGCHGEGIRIVDFRHEQSAGFAAEGWARLTRSLGVTAVTAGPGVTNLMSALAQARFNGAPLLALAGRAPLFRWGQGSLQEIDQVPFTAPVAEARTVMDTAAIAKEIVDAAARAVTPPRSPQFLDFPVEALFNQTDLDVEVPAADGAGDHGDVDEVAALVRSSQRPIVVAGSNVYLDGAEEALRSFAEAAGAPVFMNGQGRGCLPADHRLAFARSRSKALRECDVAIVAGTPLDFRLGFGQSFGPGVAIVHVDAAGPAAHVELAAGLHMPTDAFFAALAGTSVGDAAAREKWVAALRAAEQERAERSRAELSSEASPVHPMRIYGELAPLLERDAVIVCDGGDFASYAGREIPVYEPGSWLDPGPFGCLGCGFGYAAAARLAHPDRQVVVLLGDGAAGFQGMEMDTLVRHRLPVVCVVGNNGIWGLEKHPMRAVYGHDVAADLQQGARYDDVMRALGGDGETVTDPDGIRPALERAFASSRPYVVNVVTDPSVAYPRSANLL